MSQKSILKNVKPEVKAISAYTLREYDYEIKINQNENPYDVPIELKRKILDFALKRSWSRYPPFVPDELQMRLAEYTGWYPEGILVGNGSNELIQALLTVFLSAGDTLVLPAPTFTLYRLIGTVLGAKVVEIPLNPDYTYDCEALEERFLDSGDMLIICSPNNPTGALYPLERLQKLLEKTEKPIIFDEAYFEFSRETAVGLLENNDNLVVLRTFSKAFSLAGLRVGYGLMSRELAKEVGKAKLPYNINFFSIAAAITLIENLHILERSVNEIIEERDRLIPAMNEIEGVTVFKSHANFILFKTPYDSDIVFEKILGDGVLVRNLSSNPVLANTLRVTVSKPSDNKKFINSLSRVMGELTKER